MLVFYPLYLDGFGIVGGISKFLVIYCTIPRRTTNDVLSDVAACLSLQWIKCTHLGEGKLTKNTEGLLAMKIVRQEGQPNNVYGNGREENVVKQHN